MPGKKESIAFLRQVRYIFRAETITGQGLGVPHQSRKRYSYALRTHQGGQDGARSLRVSKVEAIAFFEMLAECDRSPTPSSMNLLGSDRNPES